MVSKNNKEVTDKLISVLSKPVSYRKVCENCGAEFGVNTNNSEIVNCLPCQVKLDMKLSDDCIINYNILNLWKAKRFDRTKGIDPFLCSIAEGIMLLPDDVKDRNHLSVLRSIGRKIPNDEIEAYTKKIIKKSNGRYDAILFLRFNAKEDFSIFRLKLSERLVKKLSKKDALFIKKFMISLTVKTVLKKARTK